MTRSKALAPHEFARFSAQQLEDCDLRINTAGKQVVVLLFVLDIERALGCSTSRAYEVIRECRGYPVGRGRAALLPSVFRDWCIKKFGRPIDVPGFEYPVVKLDSMTPDDALRLECERLRELPESPGELRARARATARAAGEDVPEPKPPERRRRLPTGLQLTQPRTPRRKVP